MSDIQGLLEALQGWLHTAAKDGKKVDKRGGASTPPENVGEPEASKSPADTDSEDLEDYEKHKAPEGEAQEEGSGGEEAKDPTTQTRGKEYPGAEYTVKQVSALFASSPAYPALGDIKTTPEEVRQGQVYRVKHLPDVVSLETREPENAIVSRHGAVAHLFDEFQNGKLAEEAATMHADIAKYQAKIERLRTAFVKMKAACRQEHAEEFNALVFKKSVLRRRYEDLCKNTIWSNKCKK